MRSLTLVTLLGWALLAVSARAGLDVEIGNGDKVDATVDPVLGDVYRVSVPGGAKLTVTVKGKKSKSAPTPSVSVEVRDAGDGLVGDDGPAKKAKVKAAVDDTDEYRILVTGAAAGDYQLKVAWKAATKEKIDLTLPDTPGEQAVSFSADAGALLTVKVKPSKGSAADPRLDRIEGSGDPVDLPDPQDGEKGHKLKSVALDTFGDFELIVGNDAAAGGAKGSLKIKAPPPTKRKIDLTDDVTGGDGPRGGIGAIVTPAGGVVSVDDDQHGDIEGAAVDVPAGALTGPTVIVISSSPTILPPSGNVEGAGPTVFFGPEGLTFELPVTVVIPYDPGVFMGDFTGLAIYTRDGDGNVTLVPGPYDTSVPGVVSVQVSHFSSFRVFGPPSTRATATFDLNADGADDLVVTAPAAGASAQGKVYVFFGPFTADQDLLSSDADVAIAGTQTNGRLGETYAVADASGDGTPDLLVRRTDRVLIFHGGPGFSPTDESDADQVIVGDLVGTNFGTSIAVGDVNGDGSPDVIIGDEGANTSRGRAYVFFGSAAGTFANNGSLADAVFTGEEENDLFGAAVAAGDVNDDGIDDVVVGADMVDTVDRTGAVYVFPGSATLASAGAATAPIIIRGNTPRGGLGLTIVLGDVNGDGVDDIVTNEGADAPNDNPGAIYVVAGGRTLASGLANALATRKYTGFGDNDRLGSSLKLADLGGDGALYVLALAPFHAGLGGLYVLPFSVPSGQAGATQASVVGESPLGPLRVLLDPIRSGVVVTVTAAAPTYDDGAGRVYMFLQLHDGNDSAANAEVLIDGVDGERFGGGGLD